MNKMKYFKQKDREGNFTSSSVLFLKKLKGIQYLFVEYVLLVIMYLTRLTIPIFIIIYHLKNKQILEPI